MASNLLKKAFASNVIGLRKSLLYSASRNHWNYQYKPGPYPKTPEERVAAAKKYGMTIEEYQPMPEESGYGDYPKLPDIGAGAKDPFYPYDFPELKRNFNEPMHVDTEIIGETRYDMGVKRTFSVPYQWTWFLGCIASFFAIYLYLEDYKMGRPVSIKQYPQDGPHFMFK